MRERSPEGRDETPQSHDGEARLRLAVEEAGLATWDQDLVTGEAVWSANHFRLLGYPVDPAGRATSDMWCSRLHPDDRARVLAELERAQRERTLYRCEHRVIRADDGTVVWIEPRGRFSYDSTGRAVRFVGVSLEITARKEAEERLVRRETQLDLATRTVGVGVFDHDHVENRLYWSDLFRQIHDMPPDVEPHVALLDAQTYAEDREPLQAAIAAAHDPAGDGKFSVEYRIRRRDGELRWIVGRAQTFFVGEGASRRPVRTVGAELDVTERKHIEMDLLDSEARFRTMADGSPVIIWATDFNGDIEFVNRAYCEFFGESPEHARRAGWPRLFHPDDAAHYVRAYEDAVAHRTEFRARARVRNASGEWRWIESHAMPRIGPHGEFLGYAGVSPDITALIEAQALLREADQRKDEFLATLAHELRNPLAPIRTAAELLTVPDLAGEQLSWACQVIHRQVEHMTRLLDDLLDVARITRGKLELKKERVDLGTIVDTAVEAARPLITARQHGLTVELPPELPKLDADPVRLAQVVSNLLTNAAKYTDSPGRIVLAARVEDDTVRISVKDNGIGLSPSMLAHMFEMFSQGQEAGGRGEGGLGIGLALVKGLVELHGGQVEAFSEGPGLGSEFLVVLPCRSGAAAGADRREAGAASPMSIGRKILVADDNQDAAHTLAMLLRLSGHEVRTAHGGEAALALASTFRPDIALLDIGMPDLDGYEVAKQLRRTPWGRGLRLVAVTGWGQEEDKRRARAAGFDHHLTKPVDPQQLAALLLQPAAGG
ncbi:MAG TPA: PAS domain-containing protein [Gammaproteobacteria bacterium]